MDRNLIASRSDSEEIIICNPEVFLSKLQALIQNGLENLEIITDFDLTLTKYQINEIRGPSTYQLLQSKVIIGENAKVIHDLYDYYHPIEIDPTIPPEIKQRYMNEWWEKANTAILEEGFKKNYLEAFINDSSLYFRYNVDKVLEKCAEMNIPIIIVSGGIGNLIETSLTKISKVENLKIVSNFIGFDEEGKSTIFLQPEVRADKSKLLSGVQTRKNLLLLGDLPSVTYI